jgi:hypothetical protein
LVIKCVKEGFFFNQIFTKSGSGEGGWVKKVISRPKILKKSIYRRKNDIKYYNLPSIVVSSIVSIVVSKTIFVDAVLIIFMIRHGKRDVVVCRQGVSGIAISVLNSGRKKNVHDFFKESSSHCSCHAFWIKLAKVPKLEIDRKKRMFFFVWKIIFGIS